MIDFISLFDDYSVDYALEGPNVGNNFIGIHCPWCGDSSYHGGVPRNGNSRFSCWRCGGHSLEATLERVMGVKNIHEVLGKYEDSMNTNMSLPERVLIHPERKVRVPGGALQWYHKKYLERRRYDPDKIVLDYKVLGTEPTEKGGARLYFPITHKNEVVSYQGRAITPNAYYRYMTASPDEEKVFHKSILYNLDSCNSDMVVMVEGVFDAMRLGKEDVCASFGTSFMPEQLLHLKPYSRVFMLYDSEGPAQEKAKKAASMIANITDGDVYNLDLGTGGDPDDLSNDDAVALMKELRRRTF